jgi:hypothetical protein
MLFANVVYAKPEGEVGSKLVPVDALVVVIRPNKGKVGLLA